MSTSRHAARLNETPGGYSVSMEAHAHHHDIPSGGNAANWSAPSAPTLHCLTGCAIGEVAGMAIGTGFGLATLQPRTSPAVAIAFDFFGTG